MIAERERMDTCRLCHRDQEPRRGYLHYLEGDVVREVAIGEAERRAVLEVLAELQEVVTTEAMPPRAPASRCRDCVYRKVCV